jgi:hypothetical protein
MTEELAAVVERMQAMRGADLHMPEGIQDLLAWRWTSLLQQFPALLDNDDAWDLAKAAYLRGLQDAGKWRNLAHALEDLLG